MIKLETLTTEFQLKMALTQCLVHNNEVVGVFVLNNFGRLLLQTNRKIDYSNLIIDAILPEISRFTGLVGDWELTKQCWDVLKSHFPTLKEKVCKKEILYQCKLNDLNNIVDNHQVGFLNANDYSAWDKLQLAFCEEMNSVLFHNDPQRQQRYLQDVDKQNWWGLFIDQKLVAICACVSRFEDCAQVGGVYTAPEMRNRGLAKQMIKQLMLDSKNKRHVKKLILFTHEENFAAQKIYENLGFKPIGYFGLIVGGFC